MSNNKKQPNLSIIFEELQTALKSTSETTKKWLQDKQADNVIELLRTALEDKDFKTSPYLKELDLDLTIKKTTGHEKLSLNDKQYDILNEDIYHRSRQIDYKPTEKQKVAAFRITRDCRINNLLSFQDNNLKELAFTLPQILNFFENYKDKFSEKALYFLVHLDCGSICYVVISLTNKDIKPQLYRYNYAAIIVSKENHFFPNLEEYFILPK